MSYDEVEAEVKAEREKRAIQVRFIAQLLAGMYRLASDKGKPLTFEEVVHLFRAELAKEDGLLWDAFTEAFAEACEHDDVDGTWIYGGDL